MRILVDLQAYQTGSKYRGVGRYVFSLNNYLIPKLLADGHEVVFLFNKLLEDENDTDTSAQIKEKFGEKVQVEWFDAITPVNACDRKNSWRLRASEILREAKIIQLQADLIYVSTLLPEGWLEEFVFSVGHLPINANMVTLHYDLIPLNFVDPYLLDHDYKQYYMKKVEWLKKSDKLLCISEYTKQEAKELLALEDTKLINISSAVGEEFLNFNKRENIKESDLFLQKFDLNRGSFFLYAPGGFDFRKNLNNFLEAYASLPREIQREYPLVLSSKLDDGLRSAWRWKAGELNIPDDCFILTDYVSDEELRMLYSACHTYVFPSLHEGFGLPVLEAMACGAAVVASNTTSIPEVIGGLKSALFDPKSVAQIAETLLNAVTNKEFHNELKLHAFDRVKAFSWESTADKALRAINDIGSVSAEVNPINVIPSANQIESYIDGLAECSSTDNDLKEFRNKYETICGEMDR